MKPLSIVDKPAAPKEEQRAAMDFGAGMFLHEADAGALTDPMKAWLDNLVIEIQLRPSGMVFA